ncbi:trafficking protein particle complex subunit 4 [Galleria mellonella]|uniref:Trafficking protein particle complex subunit n=1 Tax=Galleria mellonella TaxID=7137 RepID=A0A6J1WLW5_GALME|nr:trafficking protein particle complex subunit 4 [Galleria mellonella]
MVIYGIYIVSKSGGLIYNYDHVIPKVETEKTFGFPLDLKLQYENKKVVVAFGQRDGINVGHVLLSINGAPVNGRTLEDGKDVFEVIETKENYPLSLKFGRARATTNEKIVLASMFYPLFALASQLSPVPKCSGIESLTADTFKLSCFQTLTGVKFIIVTDPNMQGSEVVLKRIYELYSDYALKNPFYSLEMPIRCELFDTSLHTLLELVEKSGTANL